MRILHAPWNIAGQASSLAKAQRELGHKADVLVFKQNEFNFHCDYNLDLGNKNPLERRMARLRATRMAAREYDVVHFHYGQTLIDDYWDVYYLNLRGKRKVMHFWGSDIIQSDVASDYTLLGDDVIRHNLPKGIDDNDQRRKVVRLNRIMDATIVGDFSLLPFSPKSVVLRQTLDIGQLPYVGPTNRSRLKIAHAPTNRQIKGTDHILRTIGELKAEGLDFDFELIEKKPHEDALRALADSDIVVDDVLQGPYGILSLECMAIGKVVLDRIDPKLAHHYPDLPVLDTTPDNLKNNLKKALGDAWLREDLGKRGRAYVERYHDALKIAQQSIDLYQKL